MRTIEKKKSRESSYRTFYIERAMNREGNLKSRCSDGMSRDEFKRRLQEDLKIDR